MGEVVDLRGIGDKTLQMQNCPRCLSHNLDTAGVCQNCCWPNWTVENLPNGQIKMTQVNTHLPYFGVDLGQKPDETHLVKVDLVNGVTTSYSMQPITEYIERAEKGDVEEAHKLIDAMNEEQKRHALSVAALKIKDLHRQIAFLMTKAGQSSVEELRKIHEWSKQHDGEGVWPELE